MNHNTARALKEHSRGKFPQGRQNCEGLKEPIMTEEIVKRVTYRYGDRVDREAFALQPELYCPSCGGKGLWEDTCDDYYQGCGYWCLACSSVSHLDSRPAKDDWDKARIEALRKAVG